MDMPFFFDSGLIYDGHSHAAIATFTDNSVALIPKDSLPKNTIGRRYPSDRLFFKNISF